MSSRNPDAEDMVRLLITITRFEGSRKDPPDNTRRMAAAIRAFLT